MYSTAYNRVRHCGIYGLVIDKYTITEYATTAARGDFPLRHSSLRGLCALPSESSGWVSFFSIFYRGGCPTACPLQVGILADSRHVVDGISLEYLVIPILEYHVHASLDCVVY